MPALEGKTVIVTGGSGALGRGVVAVLAVEGANVLVADRPGGPAAVLPPGASLLPVDLLQPESVDGLVSQVLATSGRIDGLVCLAGGFFGDTPAAETPADALREQFELNVVTAFNAIHAALPHMLEAGGGAIVAVSSRPALRAVAGTVAYGSSKLAVAKIIETVAEEYREQGIRANAIAPSIVDTPGNRASMPNADFSRWVAPEAIGRVVRFLVSDEALPISGAVIPVYGRA